MDITDLLITIYCIVDDSLHLLLKGQPLRKRGPAPALSDAEAITLVIVSELSGIHADKYIWRYCWNTWHAWFPRLGSRSAFVRQIAGLWQMIQQLHALVIRWVGVKLDATHVIDGFPIRVCRYARAQRCRLFMGEASLGYCAAQKEYFYGFKGHLLVTEDGWIVDATVTSATIDEREAAWDVLDGIFGWLIADKGYISLAFNENLRKIGVHLRTPLRKNMVDPDHIWEKQGYGPRRRIVETIIDQVTQDLGLAEMRARDLWHMTVRVGRKLLAHTLANLLCWRAGLRPTQHTQLLAA